ncbi:E3 ubiquitin-protein ligase BIG BROTHER-like [Hibiscus syriacus]|uniref:E3 ubiquitin-protein ligase BIG BROTHER-like n=1 Tax=Hibiscus syriacus TaxID=106335 RepID=UPI0019218D62|nr:E3 ubiquitin-protein ligase BIG BROTHER-like [Hibiscus syriacus]
MSWDPHMEIQYINSNYPYNSAGSFMEYFEGLTYQHVNLFFDGAIHIQESVYPSMTSRFYKFGLSDSGSISYYDRDIDQSYEVNNRELCMDEIRRASENSSSMSYQRTAAMNGEWERNTNANPLENAVDFPQRQHNANDYQVIWQDYVDPDNMTYDVR